MTSPSERLRDRLRQAGLRATGSRLAVLALLDAAPVPMSHPEVVDALADRGFDRATLFRNLNDLAAAGLARRFDAGDHVWRFEPVGRDAGDGPHPHFVCTDCGEVQCLGDVEVQLSGRAPRSVSHGDVEVQLKGVCDRCA